MHPQKTPTVQRKRLFLCLLILLSSVLLLKGISLSSVAQSSEERELEDKIPKHLPIKVKIKKEKEKAFKDLKNEKWLRDLELEITNTGNKPIYFLSLNITLPEIQGPGGLNMGFPIHYGRSELGDIETKAESDDIPIKPGETYVYRFAEIRVLNWGRFRKRENKPEPKKLILSFQILSFGDGTGYWRSDGLAVPRPPNERSSLERCAPEPSLNDSGGMKLRQVSRISQSTRFSPNDLPAQFLLANFLSSDLSNTVSLKSSPQSQLCCSGNNCFRSRPYLRACFCGQPRDALQGTSCSDPLGDCSSPEFQWEECGDSYCMQTNANPCGSPEPTPFQPNCPGHHRPHLRPRPASP